MKRIKENWLLLLVISTILVVGIRIILKILYLEN